MNVGLATAQVVDEGLNLLCDLLILLVEEIGGTEAIEEVERKVVLCIVAQQLADATLDVCRSSNFLQLCPLFSI